MRQQELQSERIAVLLVDDEAKNLQVLTVVLECPEYELVHASSADEALMALMRQDFAVIVLDVRMPQLDGIELARIIKQRPKTQHIPIIFLTAYDDGEDKIVQGYDAGAADFITKPVNPTILRSKVGVFIELFKKTRALAQMNLDMADEISQREKAEAQVRMTNAELEAKNAELLQQANDRALRIQAEAGRAEAEAANRAKDRFLAMLSHELRTPLSPVLHTVTLLQEDEQCPEPIRESLDVIRRNVQLEARLIDDLLDLAKIRSGKLQIHTEPTEAHELLRRALEICAPAINDKRLHVKLDFQAGNLPLNADPARIQQIFWNLITNAIKYTPEEGELAIATSKSNGMLRVDVIDSGIGIDPKKVGEIFDAFAQVHSAKSQGLGLGLAICRALTELHGGTIEAASNGVGSGATFSVKLPVSLDGPIKTYLRDIAPEKSAPHLLRLLLVEDHKDTIRSLAKLLARHCSSLRTAATIEEALQVAENYEFDVLVSDIGLPDGSGLDLMRKLTQAEGGRRIHGIALSGYGMQEDIDRSRDAGFVEHFIKPVDIQQIQAALKRIGQERELQQTASQN